MAFSRVPGEVPALQHGSVSKSEWHRTIAADDTFPKTSRRRHEPHHPCSFRLQPFAALRISAETVSVPPFKSVELRGGGHVTLRHGDRQRVTIIKGSTQFTTFHIEPDRKLIIDACNESCPHRYDLAIEIVTPNIDGVAVSGGGYIVAAGGFGSPARMSAAVSGGGEVDVRAINASSVNAGVSGGGEVKIRAENSLTAGVDGGGSIIYWGHPSVTKAVNGGGSVEQGSGG